MSMQRLGGLAAIIEAAAYVFGIAVGFSALAPFMAGTFGPLETVTFIAEHHALLYVWNAIILLLFGGVLVVLVLALHRHLRNAAPGLVATATAFGIIWAGLVIASGMIFNVGTSMVVDLIATDAGGAASTWQAISIVQDGLGGGNELVLPRVLNLLGIAVGVAGVITIVPGLSSVGIVFGLGQIVWFAWLGIAMVRTRARATNERTAAAATFA